MSRKRQNGYARWRWIHGILALVAGIPLLVQGLTGALLAYERDLRNALGDGAMTGERLAMEEILREMSDRLKGQPRWMIYFEAESEPLWVRWADPSGEERSYLVNPATGDVLERSTTWHRVFETVLTIHRRLGLGNTGQIIMGASALMLAGLLVSGLVLQIRRSRDWWRVLGFRRRERRFWLWIHGSLGTWTTPILLLLALTGPVWSFSGYRALIGLATQSEVTTYAVESPKIAAAALPRLEAILAGVATMDPGAGAKRLIFPEGPGKPARFEWAPADAPWENFRSRAWLHPQNGTVLRVDPMESYTTVDRLIRWAYPVHIGQWGGETTRILHFLAALALPFFIGTGGWLYLKRTYK